ncbi:MAG: prepilin-type N-terminal cleavage/methylation domain-containing protein [Deltaproteobacteria bacterium]
MLQNLPGYCENDAGRGLSERFFIGLRNNCKPGKGCDYLKNQQGFTLIEILVAMTLMVIGLFAVIGMQTFALQANSIANQLSVATSLAGEALEDISSSAWTSNAAAITNGTTTLPFDASTNYGTYTHQSAGVYTTTCTPTLNSPITGIVQLDITATYTFKGNTKSVTMTGYKRVL